MKLKHLALSFLLCISATIAVAQSKQFDNVLKMELKNQTSIVNNNQIVGYALFYKVDKVKNGSLYQLVILDENLKQIGSNEFEGGKELVMYDAYYESDRLMLCFYDPKKFEDYERFVKVFDLKGRLKGTVGFEPEKVKKGLYGKGLAAQNELIYNGYYNIEGKGFVGAYQSEAKTGGAYVQYIDLNGKLKWEQNITADKGDRTDLYIISTTPNTILLFQLDRTGPLKADGKVYLVGLNVANGKQIFKKSMEMNGFSYEPMMVKKTDDGKIRLIASLINQDGKILKSNPLGFSLCELNDLTGEITVVKDFVYETDLSNVLNMKTRSKTEDGFIKPHDLLLMNDGSMVLVGEFFRKTISALGTALAIASNGKGPTVQATIDDMFLLRIDNQMKATALEKVEKDKVRELLPNDMMSPGLINRYLTMYRVFSYMYTDEGMDGSQQTIVASGSFNDEKFGTVAITVDEKQGFTQKRFTLPKEKHVSYRVMRAKPGFIFVGKYNSKQKTYTVNLEKMN